MYSIGLQVLRAKLRGFCAAGSSITARISKTEKERKNRLWDRKRQLGTHCRHHLIAYGLLRGIPYANIERCAPNNKPNAQIVLEIMLAHADWQQRKRLDLAKVESLLSTSCSETSTTPCVTAVPAQSVPAPSTPSSPQTRRLFKAIPQTAGKSA